MKRFENCHLLIVDENILACSLLEDALKLIGFSLIRTASRIDTAANLIRETRCDLVFLDWKSAQDLWLVLRSEPAGRSPIMVATGESTDPRLRLAIIQAGADAYLAMPCSSVQLLFTMEHVLRGFIAPPPVSLKLYSPPTAEPGPSSPIDSRS